MYSWNYSLLQTSEKSSAGSLSSLLLLLNPAFFGLYLNGGKRWVQRLGIILLPSFVQSRFHFEESKAHKLHPTSYLDGLRGVASLFVFFCHYTENNTGWLVPSYGLNEGGMASSYLQLPFLRIIYSGRPMVHIFFVISGYVLSYKALTLLRHRSFEQLHSSLTSSVFRRAFRLYLPIIASTFFAMLLVHAGWHGDATRHATFRDQLWDWLAVVRSYTNVWEWSRVVWVWYDIHLWTIPIEMSHSLLLFIVILGLSRTRVGLRMAILAVIMYSCIRWLQWASFEFLAGMFIAELGMILKANAAVSKDFNEGSIHLPQTNLQSICNIRLGRLLSVLFWMSNFLCAIFIGGWPNDHADKTPGIRLLLAWTPKPYLDAGDRLPSYFWHAIAAVQMVLSCQQLDLLQRLFNTPVAQYLGHISYALYLMHGQLENSIGQEAIMPRVLKLIGKESSVARFGAWSLGLVVLSVCVIWAADLFWRFVDQPAVRFARWLEKKCMVHEEFLP